MWPWILVKSIYVIHIFIPSRNECCHCSYYQGVPNYCFTRKIEMTFVVSTNVKSMCINKKENKEEKSEKHKKKVFF